MRCAEVDAGWADATVRGCDAAMGWSERADGIDTGVGENRFDNGLAAAGEASREESPASPTVTAPDAFG